MQDNAQAIVQDFKDVRCSRCLQPVPPKVARCPGCGHPLQSVRSLPFVIGIAGLLALIFAVVLMYRMVSDEDAANAPAPPPDPPAVEQQQELFPDPPPATVKASQPAKPEKKPPLNER